MDITPEMIATAYRTGALVHVSYVVMEGQPRSEFTARLIATDGDTAYYTSDGVWYSRATRSEAVAWEIDVDDAWEVALLGEPYRQGLCTALDCKWPATHTDVHWAAGGREPYRCATHAEFTVHHIAAPRADQVSWRWHELTAFLLPAVDLTRENAYWAALMRDALPTPAERRAKRAGVIARLAALDNA